MAHLFLALDFDADLEANRAGNAGFVGPLFQVVPDIHITGEGSDLIRLHVINYMVFK